MPRHQKPSELALQSKTRGSANGSIQPAPNSSPMNLQGVDLGSFGGGFEHDVAAGLTPLPSLPASPPGSPRQANQRDPSKSFLTNFKSRISPEQEQRQQKKELRQESNEEDAESRPPTSSTNSMASKVYTLRRNGSTPELSLVGSSEKLRKDSAEDRHAPPLPGPRPQATPHQSEDSTTSQQRRQKEQGVNRPRIFRSKSIRQDSDSSKPRPKISTKDSFEHPPNTAPLQSDWPGSNARSQGRGKEADKRGKSAERVSAHQSEENLHGKSKQQGSGLRTSNPFGAGMKQISRTSKGFLHKFGRSGSSHKEREVTDAEYQLRIINQPLIEQTRITRISKQLSGCRDKTEYWMPSLPWRCIDYLNTNCENEGLYRIPGSGPQVKHWQRRFDTELDIDLLSEEVRDTNEIASMLKAWLRELPTEIMPVELQKQLAKELEEENPQYKNVGQPASQKLRDALSDLPPFNYYLLFAVTCHLSLLLTNKDRNKMDLNNLAVCVGPCLNLERWLFNYLVGDWRHCWQGCYTEKDALRVEEAVEAGHDPHAPSDSGHGDSASLESSMRATTLDDSASEAHSMDDRAISSGTGSTASRPMVGYEDGSKPRSRDNSRPRENAKPATYLPQGAKGFPNGAVGLGINDEPKRPATADNRNAPADGIMTGMQSINTNAGTNSNNNNNRSSSTATTPRIGHGRSRSDLPPTPVKTNADADWSFPVHAQR
ncbi:hypothetical protein DOTSEDRAFT_75315 [Dothistroma septosporum NZE10]|uniref:Rho-GAP domain-containing protein n=1 Tax=Dothistroma septosporum (strain NZE10 / CBS 128990) TaxID=675120 RepID=M2YKX9_DOTSN|nr:hypothetical protein DOTSEDRAFT_75315 [Dothistroma septosporum NZE10]